MTTPSSQPRPANRALGLNLLTTVTAIAATLGGWAIIALTNPVSTEASATNTLSALPTLVPAQTGGATTTTPAQTVAPRATLRAVQPAPRQPSSLFGITRSSR